MNNLQEQMRHGNSSLRAIALFGDILTLWKIITSPDPEVREQLRSLMVKVEEVDDA